MTKNEIQEAVVGMMNELLHHVMGGTFQVYWSKYKNNGDGGPMSIKIEYQNNHVAVVLYQDLARDFRLASKASVKIDNALRRYVTHEMGHIVLERICTTVDNCVEKAASDIANILMEVHGMQEQKKPRKRKKPKEKPKEKPKKKPKKKPKITFPSQQKKLEKKEKK